MIRRRRRTWLAQAALLLLLGGTVGYAQEETRVAVPLHVGFGKSSFLNVNVTDAKVAFRVFTESVGRTKGYDLDVVVHTYDSSEEFQRDVADGSLHLVIMTAWEYLAGGLHEYLEPRFLAIDSAFGPREYMVLVQEDSAFTGLHDLRGKDIVLLENTNCEMSEQWLRTLLLEKSLGAEDEFFGSVTRAPKPTQAVLPVFFGQADACVVSRPSFETMCELNPQLRRRLRSIAVSEPLVDSVTFLAFDGWIEPKYRVDLIEALESLHRDPHGQQILTLFKADRLAPFEDRFMDDTRALKVRHDRLLAARERE